MVPTLLWVVLLSRVSLSSALFSKDYNLNVTQRHALAWLINSKQFVLKRGNVHHCPSVTSSLVYLLEEASGLCFARLGCCDSSVSLTKLETFKGEEFGFR